ncbi:MAG: site-specific DNA-methyltransferase [Acholeplasmataceae bacterium]
MEQEKNNKIICEIYHDHMENHKRYPIKKAQLIIADIPYNLGNNAYASNPSWYVGGDNKNGESKLAGSQFFDTDKDFKINNFFQFVKRMLKPEPKETGKAPALIILCAFAQLAPLIEIGKNHGFKTGNHPLIFTKRYSAEVLKANQRIVGACEYGLVFYRDKLPKFNNGGQMVFNHMPFETDEFKKIHPTQKPITLLKKLISLYTDPGDVVIDPVAGSGSTLLAAKLLGRHSYGFEIKKNFYNDAVRFINEQQIVDLGNNEKATALSIFDDFGLD